MPCTCTRRGQTLVTVAGTTSPNKLRDALRLAPVFVPELGISAHAGFLGRARTLVETLRELVDPGAPEVTLELHGHSAGGAAVYIASHLLLRDERMAPRIVGLTCNLFSTPGAFCQVPAPHPKLTVRAMPHELNMTDLLFAARFRPAPVPTLVCQVDGSLIWRPRGRNFREDFALLFHIFHLPNVMNSEFFRAIGAEQLAYAIRRIRANRSSG